MTQTTACSTHAITVRAEGRLGFVDLTASLSTAISNARLSDGLCIAFCRHTTCGLLLNEWEDGAQEDLIRRFDVLVPEGAYYAHDDMDRRTQNLVEDERANGRAHVLQMLIGGNSQVIPVSGGIPLLGRWQRLFLLELDEPKDRSIVFQSLGAVAPSPGDVPTLERWTLEPSR